MQSTFHYFYQHSHKDNANNMINSTDILRTKDFKNLQNNRISNSVRTYICNCSNVSNKEILLSMNHTNTMYYRNKNKREWGGTTNPYQSTRSYANKGKGKQCNHWPVLEIGRGKTMVIEGEKHRNCNANIIASAASQSVERTLLWTRISF